MKELKQILKDIEKYAKSASEEKLAYAVTLSAYLRDLLKPKTGPEPEDDGGSTPPPPPPHH